MTTLAGHRTSEPHDCFLMNCKDLGPEIESLRRMLAGLQTDLRETDIAWVAERRKSPLYQCGYWLGSEEICLLPPGHERHAALPETVR